jgi:CRP-like cAMP-binding protein
MSAVDRICDHGTTAGPVIFQRFWQTGCLSHDDLKALSTQRWQRILLEPGHSLDRRDGLYLLYKGRGVRRLAEDTDNDALSLSILLPGDLCDYTFLTGVEDRAKVTAISKCGLLFLGLSDAVALIERHPAILASILTQLASDEACSQELLFSIARRSALGRMAHLLCQLECRLQRLGLSKDGQFRLGLTQAELGRHLGLSSVHVNRTMQALRHEDLIRTVGTEVALVRKDRLTQIGGFTSDYLDPSPGSAAQVTGASFFPAQKAAVFAANR